MEVTKVITGAKAAGRSEHTTEKSLQACRACLLTDCRLYSMEQCNLKEMFKQLTGLQLLDDKYPSSLCAECATFLIKCKRFREKSLTVQKTLIVLSNTARSVTIEQLKQMRKVKKLSSNLSVRNCDTEIYVSWDYEEESPTSFKVEQIDTELTRDCKDNCVKLSTNSLVTQNTANNFDDLYACEDWEVEEEEIEDEEEEVEDEEEIPTILKGVKIKTELTIGCESNLAQREYIKLSSNSLVKQNPLNNFDTDVYVCEDGEEETPININDKKIKTELSSDYGKIVNAPSILSVKENPPHFSDNPCITYTYENYEENTLTTLNDNRLTIELFSESNINYNDKIKTETNHEQAEVNVNKEKKQKVEFKKTGVGSKPATKTAKKFVKNLYNCEQCDKVLMSRPAYLAHLRSEHHSTQHVCRICGLSSISRRSLGVHQSRLHVIDNSHVPDDGPCCPECSLHFLTEEALQAHLQGTLPVRRIPVKHSDSEFDEDLSAEISDSSENEEDPKTELESGGEEDNVKKASTKIIKKPVPTRKRKAPKVPLDQKRIVMKNMIAVKRLTLEEQLEIIEKRKEKNQNKPHKCDICTFGTSSKKILETHVMRHSEEMGEFSCRLCHFRFKTSKAYHAHMLRHAYLYSCVECPFTTGMHHFARKHVLQFHEKQEYTCGKCGNVYRCISSYYEHQKRKHPSSQHVCLLCGYAFVSKNGMESHHLAKHLQESIEMPTLADGPSCAECSLRFMNEKALQTHMRVSHTTGRGKKMLNSAREPTHTSAVRKVVCETCGKLVNTYHIKYHLEEHAGMTFPCNICGKTFRSKTVMYQHKFFNHGKGKEYKLRAKDKKDEHAHCIVCEKTFSSKRNLQKHVERIHSSNIVRCNFCDKEFRCKENLKTHIDHVHLKKPWKHRKRVR